MIGTRDSFCTTLDLRDAETHTHCRRVAGYALILGRRLGLSRKDLLTVEQGVLLHDIGKVHVPDRILKKTGILTDAEWKIMKTHTVTGYAMLSAMPALTEAADIVLAHHERCDGTGYPHRLEGQDIPPGARICAVADCLDALTSPDQTFRRAMSFSDACQYVVSERERRFDPDVVDAFISIQPCEWRRLQDAALTPRAYPYFTCPPQARISLAYSEPAKTGSCPTDPPLLESEQDEHSQSFRELVFSGHFDKPAATVVAC